VKRPAFQFYPADWRKDPALSGCSLAAQGLWINLLCVAHEADEYGHLAVNGAAMTDLQIARAVGESPALVKRLLGELETAGVFSRDDKGAIFCRRMERDEVLRNVRADCGRLGGNPRLLKQQVNQTNNQKLNQNSNQPVNQQVNQPANQKPTPSSSTASSTSKTLPTLPLPEVIHSDASSTENGSKISRVLDIENPRAGDPWPRRIPDVDDERTLEHCAKAYGIDIKTRRFDSYSELRNACFAARNTLHELHEREQAVGAKGSH
jgi:hypothetical protein